MSFDDTRSHTLPGLFRPELDFLDWVPFYALALALVAVAVAAAVVAVLMLARRRSRRRSSCIPGRAMSRDEALGHLRRVKAELKGRKGETAVADVLARAGLPALHDVILRDAWGLTQVDHLVRLADGIAVLETKAYSGRVTGGLRDRHWVQHLRAGQVRTAFGNPLLQNYRHVMAVRELAGAGVPVDGLVVSAGSAARFCGELESAVVRLSDLAARLCTVRAPVGACSPARLDAAWRALTTAAARSANLREAHGEQVRHWAVRAGRDR